MNKIYNLKDYNAKAYSRYVVELNQAIRSNSENIPAMSKYVFDKATGYVVIVNDSPKYFSNRIKAQEYLIKVESEK
jgi:hypothetical protein